MNKNTSHKERKDIKDDRHTVLQTMTWEHVGGHMEMKAVCHSPATINLSHSANSNLQRLFSCHSSPMAVLTISALLSLAASSNLVMASLQDFFCEWRKWNVNQSWYRGLPFSQEHANIFAGVRQSIVYITLHVSVTSNIWGVPWSTYNNNFVPLHL